MNNKCVDLEKNCYCLTVYEPQYEYMCKVFKKYNIPIPKRYYGISCGFSEHTNCLIGHISIIIMAKSLNLPYVIVYEDDAYPCIDANKKLNYYLKNIPKNCGILVLGRCGCGITEKYNDDFLIPITGIHGAHSYIVFQSAYDEFLSSLTKEKYADSALKNSNFNFNNTVYCITNSIFIQKNITNNCMFRTNRYIFNDERGGPKRSFCPPDGFEENKNLNPEWKNIYIIHYGWQGICNVNFSDNILYHNIDFAKLIKIKDNEWKIEWANYPKSNEYLIFKDNNYIIEKK